MKHFSKLIKATSLICGLAIAANGFVWFWIGTSGAIQSNSNVGYFAGAGFLMVAAPFLAFPFHRRSSKILAIIALLLFACIFLWLAFQLGQPFEQRALVQVAAIALVVLLFARVGLAWYRRRVGLAT